MNIIFEVDDLKEASPATISRNGMVLVEQDTIDYEDLILSYSINLPSNFDNKMKNNFKNISLWLIKPLLYFLFKNCTFGLPTDKFHLTNEKNNDILLQSENINNYLNEKIIEVKNENKVLK